jgi:hypothetical protein
MLRIKNAKVVEQSDWFVLAIICVRVFAEIDISLVFRNLIDVVLGNVVFNW